jgi:universal stress protein A
VAKYTKVLLAVDFAADNDHIIEQAEKIVEDDGAELCLIHAHEPVVTAFQAGGLVAYSTQVVSLDEEIRKIEETRMKALGEKLGVPEDHRFLPFGKASEEIKRVAEEQGADLIVIGTHGRHGFSLILGSTANAVLHGVTCDVLSVRTIDTD